MWCCVMLRVLADVCWSKCCGVPGLVLQENNKFKNHVDWDNQKIGCFARLHRLVRCVVGLIGCAYDALWWSYCEQPTASSRKGARVDCGFGPTRVTPPSSQDDEDVRTPALVCVLAGCVCRCMCGHGYKWRDCGVMLSVVRTPPRWRCRSILVDFGTACVRQVIKLIHLQPVRGISNGSATCSRPQSRAPRLTRAACLVRGTRL